MFVPKLKYLRCISFPVKCKWCSDLETAQGFLTLLILISACFEFEFVFTVISLRFRFYLFIDVDLWLFNAWNII